MSNIKITISNCQMNKKTEILNNSNLSSNTNVELNLENSIHNDDIELLNGMSENQLNEILNEAEKKAEIMDTNTPEYAQLVDILESDRNNRTEMMKKIAAHLGNFAEGVLINVISNCLTPR